MKQVHGVLIIIFLGIPKSFGVDNSSLSYIDNYQNNFLVSG